ncbi:MAG: twin-arginine translocase TatA/TatE family subunit [Ignavibacteriaceae bacterium]|nr:twin-arginine translocase TatA/TatE family subunit [Ignavibacteriaceae bacterium]
MFSNIGAGELLVVGLIALLIFGPKKLPELFRGFGKSMREFQKAVRDVEDEIKSSVDIPGPDKKNENNKPKS